MSDSVAKEYTTEPIVISGYSSQRRAKSIAKQMGAEFVPAVYEMHNNEEIKPFISKDANLRDAPLIIVAGGTGSPNNIIFETQSLQAIARSGWSGPITTVVPNLVYGRQDSNFDQRAPVGLNIALKNLFDASDRAIICDPHNPTVTNNYFQSKLKPYRAIHYAVPFAQQISALAADRIIDPRNCVVMGLDKGGATRMTEEFIAAIRGITGIDMPNKSSDITYLDKSRDPETRKPTFHGINNRVSLKGKDVIIFEDMLDTGGSVIDGVRFLKKSEPVRSVTLFATNGLFSAPRIENTLGIAMPNGDDEAVRVKLKRMERNPDTLISINRIEQNAGGKYGVDAIFISNNMDHALTDPKLARAIRKSVVIHEMDTTPFVASLLNAMHNHPNRRTNSVQKRLEGDPAFRDEMPFTPTPLKPNSPLLKLARR